MGSFYRRFVKNYADIVRPMTDLTKKGKKFVWTDQCETAFHRIKQELTGANIMGHPNNADEFILDVDASGTGIGAVLQQVQEGRERYIAYASRSLNRAERNYCITQQELLAVRYFVDYFRQYLLGRKFKIRSDHQALIWLFRLKEPRGRIARWIEVLSAYNFSIEYRAGKKMGHADALSRCDNPHDCECPNIDTQEPLKCGPCKKCQKRAEEMILETPDKRQETPNLIVEGEISQDKDIGKKAESREVINGDGQELIAEGTHMMQNSARGVQTRNQAQKNIRDTTDSKTAKTNIENWPTVCNTTLAKAQQEDQYFKPIYKGLKADKRPTKEEMVISSPETRHYWIIWDTLCLINDVIIRKFSKMDGTGDYYQCLVPKQLRKNIIFQAHDCILSGHLGSKRTAQKLLQKYYWYNLKEEVNNYIMRCDICEANKFPQKKPKAPLGSLLTGAPLDCLATDILGPLPTTPRNNKYVLVVTDHFTKWVEIFPVPNQNAETCASVILNEVIARFGSPLSIHSDQGRNYESNIFKELCRMLEVRDINSKPGMSQYIPCLRPK
ncbi:Retrovirus-related Pol polyprotein from transposon 17.6,Retrovirus-related Pol polyprotein from transposon 412,Retrovirus-related Pol polyprotein from transposon 297 [Mytilus edulis]|uniref:Retrovirus-related Pol polyprotein from transposon 17.6,Retrovirus-related Pol polyprotein from transposon 412,Retrovirus-related Pol polyprotein from transposon 297 n=1 Tax=Mytilus edulis TaxID=6550 RepID=A0A8S3UBD4_MYTED|nr:Retrovirus-related Pol polyprotein from transposon 17.6,Retrovirus-related Pol polyprotein from transposon 412,Retrovirus-related Pol polyprotein from transposon 297 [Mytilus edulis]